MRHFTYLGHCSNTKLIQTLRKNQHWITWDRHIKARENDVIAFEIYLKFFLEVTVFSKVHKNKPGVLAQ